MGWLRDFLAGTPLPAPPERSGPFLHEEDARAEARRLTEQHVAHLNAFEGFMEVEELDDGWYVVEHRGRRKPGWDAPSYGGP